MSVDDSGVALRDSGDSGRSGRGDMYRFLSTAFLSPPNPESLAAVQDPEILAEQRAVFSSEVVGLLTVAQKEADAATLRQEFMDLFKVPTGKYLPPYEAVHRDSREVDGQLTRGLLMGPSTIAVRQMYESAGAKVEVPEISDHIGLELSFMAFLCDQEDLAAAAGCAEEARNYREYQQAFLRDHVMAWVPKYCGDVAERCDTAYFKAICGMTAEFCAADSRRVNQPGAN